MKQSQYSHTPSSVPQIMVQTGLRAGDPVVKCQNELDKLEKRYKELVSEAYRRGIPVP